MADDRRAELSEAVNAIVDAEQKRCDALAEDARRLGVGVGYATDPAYDDLPIVGEHVWPNGETSVIRAGFVRRPEPEP